MHSKATDPARASATATAADGAAAQAVLSIAPSGHPCIIDVPAAAPALPAASADRIRRAFAESWTEGLLHLATGELDTPLPNDFHYLRSFARDYLTRLCHQPEMAASSPDVELPAVAPPGESDLAFRLLAVPPMRGAEYLSVEVLSNWWAELDALAHRKIAAHKAGPADWIRRQNALWRSVGRVTFHLAENKRDDQRPFAFMATYTEKVTDQSKPRQLPLSKALTQYAAAKDHQALLRLLQPIDNAARQCPWLQEMVVAQAIYQPRAWTPRQAYQLLQDIPRLEESGLIVRVPDWWRAGKPARPAVKITVGSSAKTLTADCLLDFQLETVLEGEKLDAQELAELLSASDGLVRLRGQWVEVDREKLAATLEHWRQIDTMVRSEGITFYAGMRLLAGLPADGKNLASEGDAALRAWSEVTPIGTLAEALRQMREPTAVGSPAGSLPNLQATLRPYQEVGVSWLRFLTQLGLGACLADDMGLGKTIQVIGLLLHLKHDRAGRASSAAMPSLLVAPASLLANWDAEIRRFAPSLRSHIAHGSGEGLEPPGDLVSVDLVITTYGMASRLEWIKARKWRLVVLDEAQAIKNAGTRQAKSVKALHTSGRIALTGTPVENRLSDLWSLFDFINPGLLGNQTAFARFAKALSRGDAGADYGPLWRLVQPYILRRLKTDRRIIADLPDKTEVIAWCPLAKPQASLYAQAVRELSEQLKDKGDEESRMKRRGMILAFLMRFKQICNHPAQWTGDGDFDPAKSGKFERLRELCEEIASRQEKALIFTQFREITGVLAQFLQGVFGRSGLTLDGGTAVGKRRKMVEAFQDESGPPFFVLSIKAGGTGLNLTAASHVIHFDRWWNPAVENQATDRAFRIGQKKNVLVHKFVCRGTIEEKIDALIESKRSLARDVVEGGGEAILTEMKDEELLRLVSLDISASQGE